MSEHDFMALCIYTCVMIKCQKTFTLEGGGEDETADPVDDVMFEAPGDLVPSSRLDCKRK